MPVFRIIVPVLLLLAGAACLANPDSGISGGLGIGVIIFALLIEAGVNAFILLFAGMNFGAVFLALALSNLIIYPLVFYPLREVIGLWPAEALVFFLDAGIIFGLGRLDVMQGDGFERLSWQHAVLASFFGNLVSYFIGQWAVGRTVMYLCA